MLQALALAAACSGPGAVAWAAPVLPARLDMEYADGVHADVTVRFDAAGKVLSASVAAPEDALPAVRVWAETVVMPRGNPGCTTLGMRFFPAASGALGLPMRTGGVDFGELTYEPCYAGERLRMHAGGAAYFSKKTGTDLFASVENVFAGTVNGTRVAVVHLRCEYPVGFDDKAELYVFDRLGARAVATLATFDLPAPDDPYVEGGWLHVKYASGKLYLSAWQYFERCKLRDWLEDTYTFANGRAVRLGRSAYHDVWEPRACDGPGGRL